MNKTPLTTIAPDIFRKRLLVEGYFGSEVTAETLRTYYYAVWESVAHFRQALSQPEFQEALKRYPPSSVGSPHLFEKVAVPNICVA